MTISIIADSACDLPLSWYQENNVSFIPLQVHLDGNDYEDLRTIEPVKVYEALREGKSPKTSQASPDYVKNLFTRFAQEKKQGVYIAFSSQLSGTYQTAVMVYNQVKEEYPELDIEIIDTKCASLGQGLIVQKAAELAAAGADQQTIVKHVQFMSKHMIHYFTVDDLEYLARGGRISRTSAFVGGLLNIKPLLHVEDGKLVPLEKLRGKKKLVKRVLELMGENGASLETQTIAISHGDVEETAMEWKEAIEAEFGTKKFVINTVGATVGAHAGPGTIAIFFLDELPEQP